MSPEVLQIITNLIETTQAFEVLVVVGAVGFCLWLLNKIIEE